MSLAVSLWPNVLTAHGLRGGVGAGRCGRNDNNTVMMTQHSTQTTHDKVGLTPERVVSFISVGETRVPLGQRGEAVPIAMQTDLGTACRLLPNYHSAVNENNTEQNKQKARNKQKETKRQPL